VNLYSPALALSRNLKENNYEFGFDGLENYDKTLSFYYN
jgi:hypothetical protein